MSQIKIFEMFMRDGLQSLKTSYTLAQKIKMFDALNKCNYDCIEFGSTTSPKLIPQMDNSYDLWNNIKSNNKTKYTMLVPSINHLPKVFDANIKSYGFITSLSNEFSKKNMKMSNQESFEQAKKMIIMTFKNNPNAHIRIYISCSFGCPLEGLTKQHIYELGKYIDELIIIGETFNIKKSQLDIVLADTVGISDRYIVTNVLDKINNLQNISLHMHLYGEKKDNDLKQNFEPIIDAALQKGIYNFDSSLFGIGGCPYAKKCEDKIIGNLSTIPLVKFLHKNGFTTNVDINKLEETANYISKKFIMI
jgi:hydroxymethylglutaryl-CoA lyase